MRVHILWFALTLLAANLWAGEKPEEKKPPEPPLKYDAWCVFSDLITEYHIPPLDPTSDHSRRRATNVTGFGRRGKWANVVLDLVNTTEPKDKISFEGRGEIALNFEDMSNNTIGGKYLTSYVQDFKIGPASEKQYHFSILCPESTWGGGPDLRMTLSSGRLLNRPLSLTDLDQMEHRLIVVVSDRAGAFTYLGPQAAQKDVEPEPGRRMPLGRRIASVAAEEFPTCWHDLTLASLIIIDGPPTEKLSDAQVEALKTYAQSGGTVLLMAGKDPARLKGPLEDLAGITVRGTAELASLESFDPPFKPSTDFSMPVVDVTAGPSVLAKRNTKTQIVEQTEKSYGSGRVVFLPFSFSDKTLERWAVRETLPKLLAADATSSVVSTAAENALTESGDDDVRPGSLISLRDELDQSFANDTPVIVQSPLMVLRFLTIFLICAVPLNYIVFTVLKRREAAWLAAPFWAVGFTIAGVYVGYSGQTGNITVNEITFLEAGSGQNTGVARTLLGIYTPQRDLYHIEFPPIKLPGGQAYDLQAAPGHLVSLSYMKTRNIETPEMTIRQTGDTLSIDSIRIQTRSTRRLEVQHRAWLNGGIRVDLGKQRDRDDESEVHLTVRNETGSTLLNPLFIKDGKALFLSTVSGSATMLQGQSAENLSSRNTWRHAGADVFTEFNSPYASRSPHLKQRAESMGRYMEGLLKHYPSGVLVAWIDAPFLPVRIGGAGEPSVDPRTEGITLLVAPVAVTNRGRVLAPLVPPALEFTNAYNPEVKSSGNWSKVGNNELRPRTVDVNRKQCTYLRIKFDRDIEQYRQAGKTIQLTAKIRADRGTEIDGGGVGVSYRFDGGKNPKERFRNLADLDFLSIRTGTLPPLKLDLSNVELLTDNTIVLKIVFPPELATKTALFDVKLELVDRE